MVMVMMMVMMMMLMMMVVSFEWCKLNLGRDCIGAAAQGHLDEISLGFALPEFKKLVG